MGGGVMFGRREIFQDRRDAGLQLAAALTRFKEDKPVILALPRGGVPVAFEVARTLEAELDLLLVRKIGAPGHQELAIGAVVDGKDPQLVLNREIIALASPPPGYIEAEQKRQLAEIDRRRKLYRGTEAPADIKGRTVIVIDDGIATGATVKAALRGVRQNEPRRLILAVPVAPPETLEKLASECDELVCLFAPAWFNAVGSHYADFTQTTDEEVMSLLGQAKAQRPPA
jgi:putative phosphoribosyl transferase